MSNLQKTTLQLTLIVFTLFLNSCTQEHKSRLEAVNYDQLFNNIKADGR